MPKFKVVAPTNKENIKEKNKLYITIGFEIIVFTTFLIPTFIKTKMVSSIKARLSNEDNKVDNYFDSHRNGLKSVAIIAAGASLAKLFTLPSNSTPKEKFD